MASLAHKCFGLLIYWLIGSLACMFIELMAHWCTDPWIHEFLGQLAHRLTGPLANLLIGSLVTLLICSLAD